MRGAAVSTTQTIELTFPSSERFALSRVAATAALIVTVMALAFGLRAAGLSTYGFSDDEINKVRAIEAYRDGHLSANAEHPMLMKLAMLASASVADAWNRIAPADATVAAETAVRLPNAIVGAATTWALFGVCDVLFGAPVAVMAALFWALDVNAIAINRIGKEDTFALFFFLVGVWCYERAKQQGTSDSFGAQRLYASAGLSFGLMLASKYFPHYLGIYALFNLITDRDPGANRPNRLRYFGLMLTGFLIANVAVLSPATWRYCLDYVRGDSIAHHGYSFAGHLYANTSLLSADGIPASFYVQMITTKVPLAVLGALVPGVIEAVRRRRERGFVLMTLWLGVFLAGYSLVAVKFLRYALPLFAAVDIVAAIGVVAGIRWLLRKQWLLPTTRIVVAVATLTVCIAGPFLAGHGATPFHSLFRNAIGERLAPAAVMFPEETYDYGVREAVALIAQSAEPAAAIVSDAPGVVTYYLERSGRTDLTVRSLSAEGLARDGHQSFVIVQPEHLTFENRNVVSQLSATPPWLTIHAGDALAAQIFRLSPN
jgi:hypothetical protein